MGLSCYCDDESDYFYAPGNDFSLLQTKKSKRCKSCKSLIRPGSEVLKCEAYRYPLTDIEEKIYGNGGEIEMAPFYYCSRCGEIFLNLHELKFCINPEENMDELLKQYRENYMNNNGLFVPSHREELR